MGHYRAARRAREAAWVQRAPLSPEPPNLAGLEEDHRLRGAEKTQLSVKWQVGCVASQPTCARVLKARGLMPRVISRTQLCLNVQ